MTDDNVVVLDVVTRLDIPVERILNQAVDDGLQDVVIIGWDDEGEFYFASSKADGGNILWLLEKAKKMLMEV